WIPKGTVLAKQDDTPITTTRKRCLFMPLYQNKGAEGFYFIRKIPSVFLIFSKYLRFLKADRALVLLPGIQWLSEKKDTLVVDKRIARYFTKAFFHLLGYRTRVLDSYHLIVTSRERHSRIKEYIATRWY
ncbi:MAG: aspartoacylase, partial [Bacteroidota bacterium]